jgi:hypothetical protein
MELTQAMKNPFGVFLQTMTKITNLASMCAVRFMVSESFFDTVDVFRVERNLGGKYIKRGLF